MDKIYLLHLCNVYTLAGTTSYLLHLCQQLQQLGYEPIVLKSIRAKERKPYYNLAVHYLSDNDIVEIAKRNHILITNAYLVGHHNLVESLLKYRTSVVIHDPLEVTSYTKSILAQFHTIITIRESVYQWLHHSFTHVIHIPHPYNSANASAKRDKLCACITRLDYCKNIPTILKATDEFPIDFFGQIQDDYAIAELDTQHQGWKKNYKGPMQAQIGTACNILAQYKYSIDLTTIPLDGGGTQYSFLESWDAGSILIVHKNWLRSGGTLQDGVNCLAVNNEHDIKEIFIQQKTYDLQSMKDYLHLHSTHKVGVRYIHTLCKS